MLDNDNPMGRNETRRSTEGVQRAGTPALKVVGNMVSETEYLVSQKASFRGNHWTGREPTSVSVAEWESGKTRLACVSVEYIGRSCP